MEITGKIIINVRDATTMEIVETIEQKNVITKILTAEFNSTVNNLYITPSTAVSYEDWCITPNCVTTGYVPAGVSSPQYFPAVGATPAYVQLMRRFDAPATIRTINTVLLSNTSIDISKYSTNHKLAHATVTLSSPCTQTTTQILDVYYRVQASASLTYEKNYNNVGYSPYLFLSSLFNINSCTPSSLFTSTSDGNASLKITYGHLLSSSSEQPTTSGNLYVFSNVAPSSFANFALNNNMPYSSTGLSWAQTTAQGVGKIQGAILTQLGYINGLPVASTAYNVVAPSGSPIQPIFSHAASTLSLTTANPFMDVLPATGSGTYNMGGTWTTGNLPELYKISIVTSGAVGTATYTFEKRNHVGFQGTSYGSDFTPLPGTYNFICTANSIVNRKLHTCESSWHHSDVGSYGQRMEKYDSTHFISYDTTGVSRYNITNHFVEMWDSTTTPALPATNLRQACVKTSDGSIWAACANTGIYQISADGLTVTHFTTSNGLPSNVCRAIDIGRNNTVWAYTDGGMVSSADGGATWTVYNAGTPTVFNSTILTAEPSAVWYMRVDPTHANDRMCIVRTIDVTTNAAVGMIWWERSTGVVTNANGPTVYTSAAGYRRNPGWFNVSDNDSMWVCCDSTPTYQYQISAYGWPSTITVAGSSYYTPTGVMFARNSSNTKDVLIYITTYTSASSATTYQLSQNTPISNQQTIINIRLIDNTGAILVNTTTSIGTSTQTIYQYQLQYSSMVYLGNGIIVGYIYVNSANYKGNFGFITALSGDTTPTGGALEYLIWDKYGWDGANWVLGNTNPKTTHVGEEPLIHGLTSRFTNGVAGTSFIAGEYYTNGVNDGILKNNAMTTSGTTEHYLIPTSKLTSFDGVVRTYPWTTGLVVWRKAAASITINIDGSLTNNIPYRSYAMNACSKHRVFGDFSVSGTFSLNSIASYSIGIKCDFTKEYPYVREDQYSTWSFYVNLNSVVIKNSINTNVYATYTITGTTTWNITRVGNTITFYIAGVSRYSVVDASYAFIVQARFTDIVNGVTAFTINPVTINSSGVGYYTGMGDSTAGTGIYDNKQLRHLVINASDLSINGTPLTVCNATSATPPASGGVSYSQEEGMLFCHSSDVGKTVTGSYIVNFQVTTPCNIPPV